MIARRSLVAEARAVGEEWRGAVEGGVCGTPRAGTHTAVWRERALSAALGVLDAALCLDAAFVDGATRQRLHFISGASALASTSGGGGSSSSSGSASGGGASGAAGGGGGLQTLPALLLASGAIPYIARAAAYRHDPRIALQAMRILFKLAGSDRAGEIPPSVFFREVVAGGSEEALAATTSAAAAAAAAVGAQHLLHHLQRAGSGGGGGSGGASSSSHAHVQLPPPAGSAEDFCASLAHSMLGGESGLHPPPSQRALTWRQRPSMGATRA